MIYEKGPHRPSYFADLAFVALDGMAVESRERLIEHAREIDASEEARALAHLGAAEHGGFSAVPPLWLLRDYGELISNTRPFLNSIIRFPLPNGTHAINIIDSITVPVRMIAGEHSVSAQLLRESPVDAVFFRGLVHEYAAKISQLALSSIRHTNGIHQMTCTGDVHDAVITAIKQVKANLDMPAQHVIMHPRRFEALGCMEAFTVDDTVVPVITDPNVPTNLGDNRDQDAVYVARTSDINMWESGIHCRALVRDVKEPDSDDPDDTRYPVVQLYAYSAFTAARFPMGIVELSGPGMSR